MNPLGQVKWTASRTATAVNPQTVASPAQVRAILAEVTRLRPELTAFFGCLYYAALRPEEAVALCKANLIAVPISGPSLPGQVTEQNRLVDAAVHEFGQVHAFIFAVRLAFRVRDPGEQQFRPREGLGQRRYQGE